MIHSSGVTLRRSQPVLSRVPRSASLNSTLSAMAFDQGLAGLRLYTWDDRLKTTQASFLQKSLDVLVDGSEGTERGIGEKPCRATRASCPICVSSFATSSDGDLFRFQHVIATRVVTGSILAHLSRARSEGVRPVLSILIASIASIASIVSIAGNRSFVAHQHVDAFRRPSAPFPPSNSPLGHSFVWGCIMWKGANFAGLHSWENFF